MIPHPKALTWNCHDEWLPDSFGEASPNRMMPEFYFWAMPPKGDEPFCADCFEKYGLKVKLMGKHVCSHCKFKNDPNGGPFCPACQPCCGC